MMRYAGGHLMPEEVLRGGGEERHDAIVLTQGRDRQIDHDSGPSQNLGQALTRDRVDARLRRCRHRLVTGRAQRRDEP